MPRALLYTGYQVQGRARAQASRPCSQPGAAAPPPPERRVALLVAGLGSTSENGAIDDVDAEGLGYDAPDVLRFSYEGGRTPDPTDGWTAIEPAAYDAADSQIDLRTSGARLADLIEEVAELSPGTPIDLYAHSQGGLVTRLALGERGHRVCGRRGPGRRRPRRPQGQVRGRPNARSHRRVDGHRARGLRRSRQPDRPAHLGSAPGRPDRGGRRALPGDADRPLRPLAGRSRHEARPGRARGAPR